MSYVVKFSDIIKVVPNDSVLALLSIDIFSNIERLSSFFIDKALWPDYRLYAMEPTVCIAITDVSRAEILSLQEDVYLSNDFPHFAIISNGLVVVESWDNLVSPMFTREFFSRFSKEDQIRFLNEKGARIID